MENTFNFVKTVTSLQLVHSLYVIVRKINNLVTSERNRMLGYPGDTQRSFYTYRNVNRKQIASLIATMIVKVDSTSTITDMMPISSVNGTIFMPLTLLIGV